MGLQVNNGHEDIPYASFLSFFHMDFANLWTLFLLFSASLIF
jgi:hypothetical protein